MQVNSAFVRMCACVLALARKTQRGNIETRRAKEKIKIGNSFSLLFNVYIAY